jgi:membrane-bound hydrogenase subunit alpha
VARASGVPKDVRQDQPYAAYADIGVKAMMPDAVTGTVIGDVYDRIIVRLMEVAQSIDVIEKCIARMPAGPIQAETKMPRLLKQLVDAEGEGIGRVEAPRGEDIHYVRLEAGMTPLAAWHVRAPTYTNLIAVPTMLKGMQIADVPITFASIDPCMSCTNRMTVTDRAAGKTSVMTYDEMHRLSVEKTRRLQGC